MNTGCLYVALATETSSSAIPVIVYSRFVTCLPCILHTLMLEVAVCSSLAFDVCRTMLWALQAARPTSPTRAVSSKTSSKEGQVQNTPLKELQMYTSMSLTLDTDCCCCTDDCYPTRHCLTLQAFLLLVKTNQAAPRRGAERSWGPHNPYRPQFSIRSQKRYILLMAVCFHYTRSSAQFLHWFTANPILLVMLAGEGS